MRWQGQSVHAEDTSALPGLEAWGSFVRSVTTPEFRGMTFHEVMARSALNRVPSASVMPFDWTVNPYRGCSHACVYCVSPDTLVLCADGRQRPIRDLVVGDEIIGTERQGAYRRYVRTKVEAMWRTRKPAHRVTLADGTVLVASGDHRFLTDRGWKHVTAAERGQRPHLTSNDHLLGFGLPLREGDLADVGDRDDTQRRRFFALTAPAITRKLDIAGTAVKTVADLRVVSVQAIPGVQDLIDITTGTGDFVANGVVSHNCYARSTHEYLDLDAGRDFDEQIVVKVNVAEVLRRELARSTWGREPVALGTNTDPYQRAEGRYRLMPGIIDALAASGTPFSVLTKGTLLRRDLPLLTDAATTVDVRLAMSIAIADEGLRALIEPGAPSFEARLATVRAAAEAGFAVSVFLMPILPHLTDAPEILDDTLARIAAAGARHVVFGTMHLRPGAKQWFWGWLERERPDLVPVYRGLYPGAASNAPIGYRKQLGARVRPLLRRHGLAGRVGEDDLPRRPPGPGPVIPARGRSTEPTLF